MQVPSLISNVRPIAFDPILHFRQGKEGEKKKRRDTQCQKAGGVLPHKKRRKIRATLHALNR